MRQMVLSLAPPSLPTLDNFVPGRNAELLSTLNALAGGERNERFVYIWGLPGSGKTHLLTALHGALSQQGVAAVMLSAPGEGAPLDAVVDAVLADDVDRWGAPGQERLFNTYNVQRDEGGVLIAAGSVPPARLQLRHDLVTRLGWGLVYHVHTLSDDEKMAAMIEHARSRGFDLNPDVIGYLLRRQARDLPGLLALLDALDCYSLENKRAITVPLVRELLAESAHQP